MATFGFEPDWAKGFTERWRFLTNVLTREDGSEQRIRLRTWPRVELEYEAFASPSTAETLRAWLFDHQAEEFTVPYWPVDAGTWVAARMLDPVDAHWTTPTLGRAPVKLSLSGPPLVAAADVAQVAGRDAFLSPSPDWAEPLADQWRRLLSVLDGETGPYTVRDKSGYGRRRITLSWLLAGSAIPVARQFVLRRQGRLKPAFFPAQIAGSPILARLDQDDIEWRWVHPGLCRLTLGILTTPTEA